LSADNSSDGTDAPRHLTGHRSPAPGCGSSARAPRAISRANNPSTWVRVSSGNACQRQAGTGKSASPRASWRGTATLTARKWVHSPVVVTAIRDEANLLARLPSTRPLAHASPAAPPTGAAPAAPPHPAPTAAPTRRHPTRRWHRSGSFPASHRVNRSPTTHTVPPFERLRRQQPTKQRVRLGHHPHLTRQDRTQLLQSVAFTGSHRTSITRGRRSNPCVPRTAHHPAGLGSRWRGSYRQ